MDATTELKGSTSKVTATNVSNSINSAAKPANQEFDLIAKDTDRANNTAI